MICCAVLCLGLMLMTLMFSTHGHKMSTQIAAASLWKFTSLRKAVRCRPLRTMGMLPLAVAGGGWCMVSVLSHITLWRRLTLPI